MESGLKRMLIAALLFLLTPFHPVLLDYLHLVTSEEARILIQNYDPTALQLMQECRNIQIQNANLLKIELGKSMSMLSLMMQMQYLQLLFVVKVFDKTPPLFFRTKFHPS